MTDSTPTFDFSHFPVLTTERLRLRQLTHADAEAIMAVFGSEAMLRYLNIDPVTTTDKAIGLIDWLNHEFEEGKGVNWGITLRENDRVIGTCGNYGWDKNDRKVDIGYHIAERLWGKGYATEVARAVVRWCFDNFNVHRVQADCTEGNIGSERVLLKCGFTHEGTWRESCWEHGRFVNIKQFGLLHREFEGDLSP